MGDFYVTWGFLYSMGDSTIVITARFRLTRTCFRLKRKKEISSISTHSEMISLKGFLYNMGDSYIV